MSDEVLKTPLELETDFDALRISKMCRCYDWPPDSLNIITILFRGKSTTVHVLKIGYNRFRFFYTREEAEFAQMLRGLHA